MGSIEEASRKHLMARKKGGKVQEDNELASFLLENAQAVQHFLDRQRSQKMALELTIKNIFLIFYVTFF
jgi:hypothetical protein